MKRVARPSAETLRKLYHDEQLSLANIAARYGVWFSTVAYWMDQANIKRRTAQKATRLARTKHEFDVSKNELAKLYYSEHLTLEQISCRLNKPVSTINYWMKRYCISKKQLKQAPR